MMRALILRMSGVSFKQPRGAFEYRQQCRLDCVAIIAQGEGELLQPFSLIAEYKAIAAFDHLAHAVHLAIKRRIDDKSTVRPVLQRFEGVACGCYLLQNSRMSLLPSKRTVAILNVGVVRSKAIDFKGIMLPIWQNRGRAGSDAYLTCAIVIVDPVRAWFA